MEERDGNVEVSSGTAIRHSVVHIIATLLICVFQNEAALIGLHLIARVIKRSI